MRLFPTLLLVSLPFAAQAADKTTVAELLKSGSKFDKKTVTVVGKVDHFIGKTSKSGNPYFLFRLKDGDKKVSIYGHGKVSPEPKDGDAVEVTGEFATERKSGNRTFKNEIDASKDRNPKYGVKPVKK